MFKQTGYGRSPEFRQYKESGFSTKQNAKPSAEKIRAGMVRRNIEDINEAKAFRDIDAF